MHRLKAKLATYHVIIRLAVAFVCGWFFALLVNTISQTWHIFDFAPHYSPFEVILSFPLFLGIMSAFTVKMRDTHPIALAIGTGLLGWIGMGVYWLPLVEQSDAEMNAYCATHYCHVSGIGTPLLLIYLLYGAVLVLLVAMITGFIIKRVLKTY